MDDQQVIHAMGIDDTYHVERTLASGPCGVTELVTLDGSGPFVRKRIPSKLARRGVWATLVECNCRRLPRVEATYEMPDEFIVVCDYVPGENLEQLLGPRGRLPEEDAISIVCQLCEAVSALHAHGIVHRDISPTNVIIAADGAHLIDFGIARFRVEGATRDTTQLGTYGFASPEQYGFAQTDARSDVYSLGRVLGYLLTGASPKDADKYEKALTDKNFVRPELRKIVLRASSLEPSARYQSADELVEALTGKPTPAKTASSQEPSVTASAAMPKPRKRKHKQRHERQHTSEDTKEFIFMMSAVTLLSVLVLIFSQSGIFGDAQGAADQENASAVSSVMDLFSSDKDSDNNENNEKNDGSSFRTGGGVSANDQATDSDVLEVAESGWSVDKNGCISYAIGMHNSGDVALQYASFTITGRDTEGAVLFSQEQAISTIGAGETVYFGGIADYGGYDDVEDVEFSANSVESFQLTDTSEPCAEFSVSNTREGTNRYGEAQFTGEITTIRDDKTDYSNRVAISVVLRDESGSIISGVVGFADRPDVGESNSFEVSVNDSHEYASYEIYAIPWI